MKWHWKSTKLTVVFQITRVKSWKEAPWRNKTHQFSGFSWKTSYMDIHFSLKSKYVSISDFTNRPSSCKKKTLTKQLQKRKSSFRIVTNDKAQTFTLSLVNFQNPYLIVENSKDLLLNIRLQYLQFSSNIKTYSTLYTSVPPCSFER